MRSSMKERSIFLATLILLVAAGTAYAQQASPRSDRAIEAAFLFAYRAEPGKRAEFDEGYRRHLDWHREHQDPFVWYAWDVVTGDDVGLFVDATFGQSPAEFDQRVAPAEDGADFAATAEPFANPVWRRVYRHRPELGTTRFLEERTPSPAMRVMTYHVRPGMSGEFEHLLARSAEAATSGQTTPALSWSTYEIIDGDSAPTYLLLVPAKGLAILESGSPTAWLTSLEGGRGQGGSVADALSASVERTSSALWVLRRDLTVIP